MSLVPRFRIVLENAKYTHIYYYIFHNCLSINSMERRKKKQEQKYHCSNP